jgi:hypothetical protein
MGVGQSALLNLKRAAIAAEVCAIGWLIHTEDLFWIIGSVFCCLCLFV